MNTLSIARDTSTLRLTPLEPFGILIENLEGEAAIQELSHADLKAAVAQHRIVVLRGFVPFPDKPALAEYCATWGELLSWDFGTVFEVVEHEQPVNYLFTSGSVPYHWDGAFASRVPWLQFFQCLESPGPGAGGETLFCDTVRIWADADVPTRALWKGITIRYATQKRAHYGGHITAPLVGRHPGTGETVLRFAEPANATTAQLNTPELEVHGIPAAEAEGFLGRLREVLYDPRYVYAHAWQAGDMLVADNHALLHGRSPYHSKAPRRLWRVHIL